MKTHFKIVLLVICNLLFINYNAHAQNLDKLGYKGLIVPGARGSKDYFNIVIFNQSDLTNVLGGINPIKLK